MASQPQPPLPIFYKKLQPLSTKAHTDYRSRTSERAPFLANQHAIPLTIDEFAQAQRHYPIVFSSGENPIPLGLLGLNEGVNVFVDEEGAAYMPFYVPAYVRRYPWMLARIQPDSQELSLCFDPESGLVGPSEDGEPLFADGQPTETLNAILKFCEEFEMSAQRSAAFVKELEALDLLIDGEVTIQPDGSDQPYIYRGFKMVDEEKLRDLRGDELRKLNQNGILALVTAHLFSLTLVRELFAKQAQLGKIVQPQSEPMALQP